MFLYLPLPSVRGVINSYFYLGLGLGLGLGSVEGLVYQSLRLHFRRAAIAPGLNPWYAGGARVVVPIVSPEDKSFVVKTFLARPGVVSVVGSPGPGLVVEKKKSLKRGPDRVVSLTCSEESV